MTRRQANLMLAAMVTLILAQVVCMAVLLRGQEQIQQENRAIERLLSGTEDSAGTVGTTAGASPMPGNVQPPPAVAPPSPAPLPRIVFPEEDIRNARQRVETLKAELHKATAELNKLTKGDD